MMSRKRGIPMRFNLPKIIGTLLMILPAPILKRIEAFVFPRKKSLLPASGIDCIGIVFGGDRRNQRAEAALDLYDDGCLNKILVSGGYGVISRARHETEAKIAHDFLINYGVLDRDILIEDRAKNTRENVAFSHAILRSSGYTDNTAYVIITSDFHIKRAVGLFCAALKEAAYPIVYWQTAEDRELNLHNWRNTPEGRFWIVKEYLRLHQYLATGKIKLDIAHF